MPRRRAGTLVPLEQDILRAGLARDGERFHGFALAEALAGPRGRALIAHGTLYKALGRLQEAGLLAAVWEDPDVAAEAGRPRRKLYDVTPAGAAALAAADRAATAAMPRPSTA